EQVSEFAGSSPLDQWQSTGEAFGHDLAPEGITRRHIAGRGSYISNHSSAALYELWCLFEEVQLLRGRKTLLGYASGHWQTRPRFLHHCAELGSHLLTAEDLVRERLDV